MRKIIILLISVSFIVQHSIVYADNSCLAVPGLLEPNDPRSLLNQLQSEDKEYVETNTAGIMQIKQRNSLDGLYYTTALIYPGEKYGVESLELIYDKMGFVKKLDITGTWEEGKLIPLGCKDSPRLSIQYFPDLHSWKVIQEVKGGV